MPLVLKSRKVLYFPFLIALRTSLLVFTIAISVILSDQTTAQEMIVPFLAMMCMGLFIFIVISIPLWISRQLEKRAILHLLDNQWKAFAEDDYQRQVAANQLPWRQLLIILTIFVGLIVYIGYIMQSAEGESTPILAIAPPIGVIFAMVLAETISTPTLNKHNSKMQFLRRLKSPIPNIYIGKHGLYSEDTGYISFRSVNQPLTSIERGGQSRMTLRFSISIYHRFITRLHIEEVAIPPPKADRGRINNATPYPRKYYQTHQIS